MEIKFRLIKVHRLFFIFIILSSDLISDDKNEISQIQINSNIFDRQFSKDIIEPINSLDGMNFNLNIIVDKFNKEIPKAKLNKESTLLGDGEYYQLKGIDNKLLLFDGSFIVQFKELPDLKDYASLNGLLFIDSLSDINMGIFKTNNISELKQITQSIKNDSNVSNVRLNTIDPSLENQ